MSNAKLIAILFLIGLFTAAVGGAEKTSAPSSASAETTESWQKEFDAICSKTQDAMSFSAEELTTLVQRCDALQPRIEKLDETRKKVYLRRLRQCRGLFAYVLDSKQKENK